MPDSKLPPVPLTPEHVDLMRHPKVLEKYLQRLRSFFRHFEIPWYIQSSLATRVYGVDHRNVTDLDIRANWPIQDLYTKALLHLDPDATLRPPVKYAQGEFRNHCIILDLPELETHIDIITEIRTYRSSHDVLFPVPFDPMAASKQIHPDHSRSYPVCSLEYLVIYKLVNSRDGSERKNDLGEAALLLNRLAAKWASCQD